jgi:hypothetical protein
MFTQLSQDWSGPVWKNLPHAYANVREWVRKAYLESLWPCSFVSIKGD